MIRFKRGLAILLSTCMIGGMMPLPVSAEEAVPENIVQTKSTENTENLENAQSENYKSSETESETTTDTEAEDTAIADVQTLIDALPDAYSITEDNVENVTSQLDTIDEAKAELSDADMSQLDLTRYDAAINKVMVLMGMKEENDSGIAVQANDSAGKTEQQSTDEASVTINGETLYYTTLEEAFSAADGKTATITMLNDAECTVTSGSPISVMNGSNITLNMNGKTLSGLGTGDCGIITLATGSLSVQGPGTMKSTHMCLSCASKNAKMTVGNITFDVSEADYGVWVVSSNTVTLNNIQIIGKAKIAAVYQYSKSANVTINNMNAIDGGYSDVCFKGNTLKINGGTFDKISVNSYYVASITSVSQVLGEGCIYRYADKTWETSELSNTLEISNVTVEKIPLTINPEAEATSWHNNSAEHRLQMNAKPTTENNEVTYEWYDGDTKLECVSDTYTIPKIMSVGNYTYTCKATCDGYTLSHEFTFTVEEEECKHEGVEITFNSSGFGNCPKCNATVYQPAVETTDKYDIDDDSIKDTVYEISNAGQLYWFADKVNNGEANMNAVLTADIKVNENVLDADGNLNGDGNSFRKWTPIGTNNLIKYSGIFNGQNHTVSGLYFNDDTKDYIGLFGYSTGMIQNVGVENSYFKGDSLVSGMCGYNVGTIKNSYNTGTVSGTGIDIGGVCGANCSTITNCYNTGTVSGNSAVGGVCGSNNFKSTIENCYNVGTISSTVTRVARASTAHGIGGLCGDNNAKITNSYYNSDAYHGNAIGRDMGTTTNVAGMTTDQFASGEIAYLLSQGCTIDEVTYDGTIWGQRLGEDGDTYPVLDSTKRVYQVDKYDGCEGKPGSSTKVYSNQSTSIYEEHKYEADTTDPTKHKCSICNGSEVHSFAYELVENGNAIKATCSECGATYTIKLTQPAAASDGKIVYDGTAKKVEAAIESGNTGIETIPESAITYATVTDAKISDYSTTVPKDAGTYKAKLTLGTGDNIVSIEINFTIEKAASPTIVGEEKSYAYSAGSDGKTIGVDIAGKLPMDKGTTTYTVAKTDTEQLLSEVTVDTAGNLTYKVNQVDSSKDGKTAIITVTASMENYANAEYTLTISITDKKMVEIKRGNTVSVDGSNVLTYGEKLSKLTLGKTVFVEAGTDNMVEGILSWSNPDEIPAIGTTEAGWVFKPADSSVYVELSGNAAITVVKATPNITEVPTVAGREYNPDVTLTDSDMTGGSAAGVDGRELAGTWSFTGTNIIPTVNNKGYQVVFTPTDTDNYNTVTRTITVKVTKAAPVITENPTASALTYGQTLSDSTLTGGKAAYKTADGTEIAGTFAWRNGDVKPVVSDSGKTEYEVVFTPSDTVNYNTAAVKLTLTINKAAKAPNMPGTTMTPAHSTKKVGDVTLPAGWSWLEGDKDTELADKTPVTATAIYTGADKGNYETESVSITITRSECEHNYTSKVTKEPTTTDAGIMTYTCSRCGHSYTQPIAKLKADDNRDNGNENRNPKPDTDNNTDNSTGNNTDNSNDAANGNTDSGQNSSGTGSENETVQGITERNETNAEVNSDLKETDTEVKPYIKDDSGKEGWEVIRLQLEEAKSGDTVTVAMNGTTVVPKEVFDSIKDKDITLALDMGNDIVWKISGNDITEAAGDIDFGVTVGADAGKYIPVDVINNVTGDKYSMNMTLAYDGQFGFTATLAVNMESKNAGLYANLFYYNAQTGKPEFICAGQIDADGNVELTFTHASDYIIVVDKAVMDGSTDDGAASTEGTESTESTELTENSTDSTEAEAVPASDTDNVNKPGAGNIAIIIIIGICILLIVSGVVIYVR